MALSSARLRLAAWLFAGSLVSPAGAADFAPLFRPFETDHVTLSPDGRHVAYTRREGETLVLVLRDLAANRQQRVPIGEDRAPELSGAKEKTPATLDFLRWAGDGRLVFNFNRRNVWSIRADGSDARRLLDPRDFEPPPQVQVPTINQGSLAPPPPSIYASLADQDQPMRVIALPRGDRHAYVEVLALNRMSLFNRDRSQIPRVIMRVDAETGAAREWGECTPRSSEILTDQQGHPRIATLPPHLRGVRTDFVYAAPGSAKWRPLDELLGPALALVFHRTPENQLDARSFPLGFDFQPEVMYFASNVGRDTFGIYALDMKTRARTPFAMETPAVDLVAPAEDGSDALVFDGWRRRLAGVRCTGAERTTLWLDPELAEVQRALREAVPRQTMEIVEWDENRTRFLVRGTSGTQPGVYYLFEPKSRRLDQFLEIAPWLAPESLHPASSFGLRTTDGFDLSGYLTVPRRARLKRPPLVVLLHDGPWDRDLPGFQREAQALATMGFAVVQVNYRGSTGFGAKHLHALTAAPDTGPLNDVLAALDLIATNKQTFDPRLVAVMGRGYGGYLALRALQLHPQRFRCAVALDAPVDLPTWLNPPATGISFAGELRRRMLGDDTGRLRAISPLSNPEKFTAPVMLIEREGDTVSRGADLKRALAGLQRECVYLALNEDAAAPLPNARAALFARIEEFLNTYVYDYAVKLGEAVERR